MPQFDSKQFEIKRSDMAVGTWKGPKDTDTLANLIKLFREEKWRGQFVVNFPGNGGVNDVVFTEHKNRRIPTDPEALPY